MEKLMLLTCWLLVRGVGSTHLNCSVSPVDLVFVADQSGSVGQADFAKTMTFLADLTTSLQIGQLPAYSQVGLVLFSHRAQVMFNLRKYPTNNALYWALTHQTRSGGGTDIAKGMTTAVNLVFNDQGGDRPQVPNVMVVLTDGRDANDEDSITDAYEVAHSHDIRTIAIGVTDNIDQQQLLQVAGGNSAFVFTTDTFTGLDTILHTVCESIEDAITTTSTTTRTTTGASSTTTAHSAYCLNNGQLHCDCPFGFTGKYCERAINFCNNSFVYYDSVETPTDVCGPFGSCEYNVSLGSYCVCEYGWTGPHCDIPVPSLVHESHRCRYLYGAVDPNPDCIQNEERCLPDKLNCAFSPCPSPDYLGWCLPIQTVNQIFFSLYGKIQ